MSHKVYFITGNANKLREIRGICGTGFPLEIDSRKIDLDEYQAATAEEICRRKCELAARLVRSDKAGGTGDGSAVGVLVEDTSLEIPAMAGMPGPYIKWFEEAMGCERLYKMVTPWEDRSAVAKCILAYSPPPPPDTGHVSKDQKPEVLLFVGDLHGEIVPPAGDPKVFGFGFDFIFKPDGHEKTLAELGPEMKNSISHRYLAVVKFRDYILSQQATNK